MGHTDQKNLKTNEPDLRHRDHLSGPLKNPLKKEAVKAYEVSKALKVS